MMTRRSLLLGSVGFLLCATAPKAFTKPVRRLVLVHGRSQQGKDPIILRATWMEALREGARAADLTIPEDIEVVFPFYGDVLDDFTRRFDLPLTSDIQARGEAAVDEDFLLLQAEIAEALRAQSGVTEAQVDEAYGDNPREKGPLNWEWVQATLRALDQHAGGLNQAALERFTRDVYLYTRRSVVRDAVDAIVADALTDIPTVVVGHSLGSVVAYSVLRSDPRSLDVPLFATVGSPLGLRAIRDQFRPLERPPVASWFNAYDNRDVVSLYPLDDANFPVSPAIENYPGVRNHTRNRHGIVGYLDNEIVARRILAPFTL